MRYYNNTNWSARRSPWNFEKDPILTTKKWQIWRKKNQLFTSLWGTHNFLQKFQPIWSSCLVSYIQPTYFYYIFILKFEIFTIFFKYLYDIRWQYFDISIFLALNFFSCLNIFEKFWKKNFLIFLHYATLQERTIFRVFFWTLHWIELSWFAFLFSELCIVCTCVITQQLIFLNFYLG